MAISSADAGTVMDMRRTMTTTTMGTGTDLASACTSVVAVADGVVTTATLAVTVDKTRGPAFCRPLSFPNFSGERGESTTLLRHQHSDSPKPLSRRRQWSVRIRRSHQLVSRTPSLLRLRETTLLGSGVLSIHPISNA